MTQPPPVLELRDLTVRFPAGRVLEAVSLRVSEGGAVGLVGESGSGKTLTLLGTLGLLPDSATVESGEVVFRGQKLHPGSEAGWKGVRGRRLACVFQDPASALNPVQRVGQQVEEVVRLHLGARPARARELAVAALAQARLSEPAELARRFPHELSGGQKQRASLAMALAGEPDVLLLDEPTSALDATVQFEFLDLLRGLRRARGLSVLFVSHDLGAVAQLCDELAVMYSGRVVEHIAPGGSARHPYTRALWGCARRTRAADGTLPVIPGTMPSLAGRGEGCAFAPRCAVAQSRCGTEDPHAALDGQGEVACFFPQEGEV